MSDWERNEVMSDWDKTYVSTNVKPGSNPYESSFFMGLHDQLSVLSVDLRRISPAIIAVASCAVGRADAVGRFFDDLTVQATPVESQEIFLLIREAITIVYPFLGMPTCIPACYGMIGVVERKGSEYASLKRLRNRVMTVDDAERGQKLRSQIYAKVGNSAIFGLMDTYFTELFACSTTFTWGYLISKANEEVFEVNESHLVVASAITALGAIRQSNSHIKATLAVGNSIPVVYAVLEVIQKIAKWAGKELQVPDVGKCAKEIQKAVNPV